MIYVGTAAPTQHFIKDCIVTPDFIAIMFLWAFHLDPG